MNLYRSLRVASMVVALVLTFFLIVPVDSYASAASSSAVPLTFEVDTPEGYTGDVSVTVLNTGAVETYTITAHYVGDYKNTTAVPSGDYVITGADFHAYDGGLYSLSFNQEEFSVGTSPVTITATLRPIDTNECTDEGAFTQEMLESGEYIVDIDLNYNKPDATQEPEETAPAEPTAEPTVEPTAEPTAEPSTPPTEAPVEIPEEEGSGITKALSGLALVLVIILFVYIFASVCRAIQKKHKEI